MEPWTVDEVVTELLEIGNDETRVKLVVNPGAPDERASNFQIDPERTIDGVTTVALVEVVE